VLTIALRCVHNTSQNSTDNLSFNSPDSRHSSDIVCWRGDCSFIYRPVYFSQQIVYKQTHTICALVIPMLINMQFADLMHRRQNIRGIFFCYRAYEDKEYTCFIFTCSALLQQIRAHAYSRQIILASAFSQYNNVKVSSFLFCCT